MFQLSDATDNVEFADALRLTVGLTAVFIDVPYWIASAKVWRPRVASEMVVVLGVSEVTVGLAVSMLKTPVGLV